MSHQATVLPQSMVASAPASTDLLWCAGSSRRVWVHAGHSLPAGGASTACGHLPGVCRHAGAPLLSSGPGMHLREVLHRPKGCQDPGQVSTLLPHEAVCTYAQLCLQPKWYMRGCVKVCTAASYRRLHLSKKMHRMPFNWNGLIQLRAYHLSRQPASSQQVAGCIVE